MTEATTDPSQPFASVWATAISDLSITQIPLQHRAFLRLAHPVGLIDDTALISVPDNFTKNKFEIDLRDLIVNALGKALGHPVRLAVTVDESTSPLASPLSSSETPSSSSEGQSQSSSPTTHSSNESQKSENLSLPLEKHQLAATSATLSHKSHISAEGSAMGALLAQEMFQGFSSAEELLVSPPTTSDHTSEQVIPSHSKSNQTTHQQSLPFSTVEPKESSGPSAETNSSQLNPRYIFDTFVIGSSNRFAHAAAIAVSEAPAKAYNPLFIYGDSGLGKTHLLHAIGYYAQSLYHGIQVRYVSSEEFTNDFINSIRDDRASVFQRRYRDLDILLVDDIQFLENKERTQEEFFHTFNTLYNANKQIVISSDRPPKQLVTLEDRLRSRFEWGLITDVQPPDLETRIAILSKKAVQEQLNVPDEVLEYIASHITSNIRELEGALIRVTAFANLNQQPVDSALAQIVLKDLIADEEGPEITAATIIAQTAAYYSLSMDALCGSSRSRTLVQARQIAMYLCRELTSLSLPKIGQQFGGRDHTTVMHANRKVRQELSEKRSVYNQVTELTNRIKSQARQP